MVYSMVRERIDNLDPAKQEKLFQAAATEFADNGFDGASLNRIIEQAGMSKGSLYYYFEDKSDLYASVVERATVRLVSLVGGFRIDDLTADTFWPSFEDLLRRSVDHLARNEWFVRLCRSFFRLRERGSPRSTRKIFDWIGHWTAAALTKGRELGVVRDDLPLPYLVDMCLAVGEVGDRWLITHWTELTPIQRNELLAAELDLFHRLLDPAGRR
ncbi:MAG: TetR/AcrR family transcriptional regulator [Gemmatimonadales bacterium]